MAAKKLDLQLVYCDVWNYTPRATWMALELLAHYRQQIGRLELVPSDGGRFELSANGKLVFSKLKEGRFPEPKELFRAVDAA